MVGKYFTLYDKGVKIVYLPKLTGTHIAQGQKLTTGNIIETV